MISKQLSIYGNTSNYVQSYDSKPPLETYDESARPSGFMDVDNGIGNKSDFFNEKRDENTINIQKIEFGIDIGVRRFVENERNLTLNPVRFLQFPDFDDVVSGYHYR